jgi:nucleoside-diphosphate-sugar epimerase
VYGAAGEGSVDEAAPPRPVTAYARAKLRAEAAIRELATSRFSPVSLRFATLYGASPSFRSDLVVNRMTSTAARFGWITISGDGSIRRPLLHVEDASRAVLAVTAADGALVHGEVFNVGDAGQNMRISEVAELVGSRLPGTQLRHARLIDPRSYAVRFGKFAERFGHWEPRVDVAAGIDQVIAALGTAHGTAVPFTGAGWGPTDRCQWLAGLRDQRRLSPLFRWKSAAPAAPQRTVQETS